MSESIDITLEMREYLSNIREQCARSHKEIEMMMMKHKALCAVVEASEDFLKKPTEESHNKISRCVASYMKIIGATIEQGVSV